MNAQNIHENHTTMKGYIIDLSINDRREKTLRLGNQPSQKSNFVIEMPANTPVSLIDFRINHLFKSLVVGTKDIAIKELSHHIILENEQLIVSFAPEQLQKEEPIIAQVEAPMILSYEDLDQFKQAKHTHTSSSHTQHKPLEQTSIGQWQNLQLTAQYHEKVGLRLLAQVTEQYEAILKTDYPNLPIIIRLKVDGITYEHTLSFAIAHKEQYLGIALDFGSESSQMAYNKLDDSGTFIQGKPKVENLYKNIVAFHKNQGWINKEQHEEYYQEERNTNFYKSIFFLKEDLTGAYENIYKELYIREQATDLKMLVNTHDGFTTLTEQHFHQLPNLKITHKYNELFTSINFNVEKEGYPINVPLGVMKEKVYNSILSVIIHSFIKKEFILSYQASKKIRFVILVPNIYDHDAIIRTEQVIDQIFSDIAKQHYPNQLLAWEILAISESDAAFLGYINKNNVNILPNREYIIIDSGKGTTDLSIIKTGQQNIYNIEPIFRNGFAGAGNLISFAVFETVIHYLRAHANNSNSTYKFIKESLIKVLNSNDLESKNKFYNEIERLKFNYSNNEAYAAQQWDNAKVGDVTFSNISEIGAANISTLSELLAQIDCIHDFYGYISTACEMIAQRTVSYVKLVQKNTENFNAAGVILTGRAFLFEPLEIAMRSALKDVVNIPDSIIQRLAGNELKDICIKGVFNKSVQLNAEKIGYPIQYITQAKAEPNTETDTPKQKKKTIQERLLKVFYGELKAIEHSEIVLTQNQELLTNKLYQSQILIGPKRYKVNNHNAYDMQQSDKTEIVFTPEGYIVRSMHQGVVNNLIELDEIFDAEDIEMYMVIPSLFPNYIQENLIYSFKRSDDDFVQTKVKPETTIAPRFDPPPTNNNGPIYF